MSLIKENHWRIISNYQWDEANISTIDRLRRERSRFETDLEWKHWNCSSLLSERRIAWKALTKCQWENCSDWQTEMNNLNDEER